MEGKKRTSDGDSSGGLEGGGYPNRGLQVKK